MITINGDCAFRQKDQETGIGINIVKDKVQSHYKYFIPDLMDNHIGEFLALSLALDIIIEKQDNQQMIQYLTDSKIVIQSLEKDYVKNPEYQEIFQLIQKKVKQIPLFFYKWIPDKENATADRIARQALLGQGKKIIHLPSLSVYFSDQNW